MLSFYTVKSTEILENVLKFVIYIYLVSILPLTAVQTPCWNRSPFHSGFKSYRLPLSAYGSQVFTVITQFLQLDMILNILWIVKNGLLEERFFTIIKMIVIKNKLFLSFI